MKRKTFQGRRKLRFRAQKKNACEKERIKEKVPRIQNGMKVSPSAPIKFCDAHACANFPIFKYLFSQEMTGSFRTGFREGIAETCGCRINPKGFSKRVLSLAEKGASERSIGEKKRLNRLMLISVYRKNSF